MVERKSYLYRFLAPSQDILKHPHDRLKAASHWARGWQGWSDAPPVCRLGT
ncbi:MAG: hypothetical protein ACE5ID_02100 [Acidobacteriota bacterium]